MKRFEYQFIGDDWSEKLRHVNLSKSGYAKRKWGILE